MKNMDQIVRSKTTPTARRRSARIARGYSLEDLAIATGLTVTEIATAEQDGGRAPEHHIERIEHVLAS
jgi:transcriptional regulator with XRE-family HTH domain